MGGAAADRSPPPSRKRPRPRLVRPLRKHSARDLTLTRQPSQKPLQNHPARCSRVAGAALRSFSRGTAAAGRPYTTRRIAGIENRTRADRAGRRIGAGARRDLPRPLLDRGGPARPARADRGRLPAVRGPVRRGRVAATPRPRARAAGLREGRRAGDPDRRGAASHSSPPSMPRTRSTASSAPPPPSCSLPPPALSPFSCR